MGGLEFAPPRQLEEGDGIENFCCGIEIVDSWANRYAASARRNGTAVVYASFCGACVAGFYSLSSQSIARDSVSGWLSRNAPLQIPVILLGMLGVDKRFQGHGLGHDLLLDAVHRSLAIAGTLGARALVVDPADDKARAFYEKYGFAPLPGTNRMFAKLV
uniref:N-acetyltransferase n=1 Tax=Muribaculaceae bacterium Z82 TaxID=2304548 RepID=A0A7C9JDS7_9BACT